MKPLTVAMLATCSIVSGLASDAALPFGASETRASSVGPLTDRGAAGPNRNHQRYHRESHSEQSHDGTPPRSDQGSRGELVGPDGDAVISEGHLLTVLVIAATCLICLGLAGLLAGNGPRGRAYGSIAYAAGVLLTIVTLYLAAD